MAVLFDKFRLFTEIIAADLLIYLDEAICGNEDLLIVSLSSMAALKL